MGGTSHYITYTFGRYHELCHVGVCRERRARQVLTILIDGEVNSFCIDGYCTCFLIISNLLHVLLVEYESVSHPVNILCC
jgi:hypothetical protein